MYGKQTSRAKEIPTTKRIIQNSARMRGSVQQLGLAHPSGIRRRPMIATSRRVLTFAAVCLLTVLALAPVGASGGTPQATDWRARMNQQLPLMGHRNWIAVVDSAYPLQTSPGIETIETNGDQLQVVQTVLNQIAKAKHVRPVIFTDAELKLVPESDAKGVTVYREALGKLLGTAESGTAKSSTAAPEKIEAQSLPHEEI